MIACSCTLIAITNQCKALGKSRWKPQLVLKIFRLQNVHFLNHCTDIDKLPLMVKYYYYAVVIFDRHN